ncbi:hypothetical protein [Streptomyces hundungensis]|uniref:proline-rich domain-containing protein n=1 Tax=Streptomyces hundungensis TaxID=1077946 RepID=UPI0031E6C83B
MSKDVIEPAGIPVFTGDLEQLGRDAAALTRQAGEFRDGGSSVHKEFQGLSACYRAPEADQLFATTLPVKTKADDFADGLEKAATALTTYEAQVKPIVDKLKSLRTEAFAFTDSIAGDDHWRRDQKKIDHNERLMNDVAATVAAFTDAERTCHDAITALVHGSKLSVDDGSHQPGMYGYSADALTHAEGTPWGGHAEREYTGLRWLWEQTKSFVWDGFIVDGIWGTIKGLGTLVGTDGWDKAGQAWTGLAKLATGIVITGTPLGGLFWTVPDKDLPSWLRDSRTAMKETGKALVAWDEWGKNPARAAGGVTFNVLTTVFTGGAGSAAKGGAVAKVLSVTGKVAKVVDPMTYVAKAGKFGVIKVGDLFGNLKNITTGRYADILAGGGKFNIDGTYAKNADLPVVKGNYIEWPGGSRLNLDDGQVYKPDGTVAPAHVELSADDIARLKSSLPHVGETVPTGAKEPALAGAHVPGGTGHPGTPSHPSHPGDAAGRPGHAPTGVGHGQGRGPEASHSSDNGSPSQHGAGSHPTAPAHHESTATHQGGSGGSGGEVTHPSGPGTPHANPSNGGTHEGHEGNDGENGPTAGSESHPPLDPQAVDERVKALDDRQGGEGHAPGRHLYPDDEALKARLGTVLHNSSGAPVVYGPNSDYAGLLKSENNVDPLTGTTVDGVHGGTHRVGPYATKFNNPEDMVRADQYFRDEIARTGEPPGPTAIDQVLGAEGHERLSGYYRNPADHSEFLPVDFEGGSILPVYRIHDGEWKLHTMFSNPAPGRHP